MKFSTTNSTLMFFAFFVASATKSGAQTENQSVLTAAQYGQVKSALPVHGLSKPRPYEPEVAGLSGEIKLNALSASPPPLCAPTKDSESLSDSQLCQPISYKYFGCSFSNKFHRPSCIFAKAISRHHLVLFQWRKQAIAAHYQPCRYCLPPVWLSTRGVILSVNPKTTPSPQQTIGNKIDSPIQKNEQPQEAGNSEGKASTGSSPE